MATDRENRNASPEPAAAPALGAVTGRWVTEGEVLGDDQPTPVVGTDTYELLTGGHFLIHYVDVRVGDEPVVAVEIIGEVEPSTGRLIARSYDNTGAVTLMHLMIDDAGAWHFAGGAEVAGAARLGDAPAQGRVRSTLRIADDGRSMHALWERADDGKNWVPWMDIRFSREGSSGG